MNALQDGLFWVERTPGNWLPMEIRDGEIYWLEGTLSIMTPQTMRNNVMGPLVKPGTKA